MNRKNIGKCFRFIFVPTDVIFPTQFEAHFTRETTHIRTCSNFRHFHKSRPVQICISSRATASNSTQFISGRWYANGMAWPLKKKIWSFSFYGRPRRRQKCHSTTLADFVHVLRAVVRQQFDSLNVIECLRWQPNRRILTPTMRWRISSVNMFINRNVSLWWKLILATDGYVVATWCGLGSSVEIESQWIFGVRRTCIA